MHQNPELYETSVDRIEEVSKQFYNSIWDFNTSLSTMDRTSRQRYSTFLVN